MIDSLAAPAQETRLSIVRLLLRHAPNEFPAGTIAQVARPNAFLSS